MKIIIADTYYEAFLKSYMENNEQFEVKAYQENMHDLLNQCFGTSFFYSKNLQKIGVEAIDIIVNCKPLQLLWINENGFEAKSIRHSMPMQLFRIPFFGSVLAKSSIYLDIVYEQVKHHRPDIFYVQDINVFPSYFLKKIKKHTALIVGQIASPLPPYNFIKQYDLILTSFPHFIPLLQKLNIKCEYFRIGFENTVLEKIGTIQKDIDVSFVGGIGRHHKKALPLFEQLAMETPIQFYGYGVDKLNTNSIIRKRHQGEVWGLDMYKTLARSKITINRHINVAENNANNMRLYEATGVGSLLITDYKENLNKLFEIGKEVLAYSSPEEAVKLVKYYLDHPEEAQSIAKAGQERTLRDHSYKNRMVELVELLKKYCEI